MNFLNHHPTIILIAGKARSGKTTLATNLKELLEKEQKEVIISPYTKYLKQYIENITNKEVTEDNKQRDLLQKISSELIKKKLIFIGTINSATTHTREIFKEAYLVSATSIICLHNHPSNDTTPSKADIYFTSHLIRTGQIQGIPVVDHIIVGEESYYSFYEHKDILNL